ncbi:MAG: aldo/keto reductase [Lachnospiraceae bacterium]|nr:aldo/keto reductase [Lachnospiraceae bacterium]
MENGMNEYFVLLNGVKLPKIGYGTFRCTDGSDERIVRMALEAGYRMLDTAAFYENEEYIGKGIKESGVPREEIFLTSKVWKTDLGYEKTRESFYASLERLQTDYLDLFLIHWPKPDPECENWKELIAGSWKAMEELYEQGKVRAIGLSNFLPHHIDALMETAKVKPMVDQLELHVGYMQELAVQYCKNMGIQVQAWSPLGRTRVLQEAVVLKMAEKYGVTPAQFLLRFLLQQDICVIPKATSMERMRQNLELPMIEITAEDMYTLKCLPQLGWSGEHPDRERVPAQV